MKCEREDSSSLTVRTGITTLAAAVVQLQQGIVPEVRK